MKVQVSHRTHDEAMIENFMNEPDYAEFYLNTVLADAEADEIALVQSWYDEAQNRMFGFLRKHEKKELPERLPHSKTLQNGAMLVRKPSYFPATFFE